MSEKEKRMVAQIMRMYGVKCEKCGRIFSMFIHPKDLKKWQKGGGYIQDILHYLSPAERELLISATFSDWWSVMFGGE